MDDYNLLRIKMGNRIQIVVTYEDGSLTTLNLPNKSNNQVELYILTDENKIIDKKTLLLNDSKLELI